MTDEEMRVAIAGLRKTAVKGGTMHTLWDLIADAEALLAGQESVLSREDVVRLILEHQL
jgi:hypothetical protein